MIVTVEYFELASWESTPHEPDYTDIEYDSVDTNTIYDHSYCF